MRPIKEFKEFILSGVVKKQSPDKSRAEFLIKESELSFEGLNERVKQMGINDRNANSVLKDCYDILMESIRAKMLLKGYNATGQGAHEAEVSYMKILGFSETEVQFADQLRYFRNGMIYYGTILDCEYAEKVVEFTRKIYLKLR
jgi:hypothetical protein